VDYKSIRGSDKRLTAAEWQQVRAIVKERMAHGHPRSLALTNEARACVIADRPRPHSGRIACCKGEMVCHGGMVATI
jgi:hypothetical protein